MRPPILVFTGGLHVHPSAAAAERALAPAGVQWLDAFDASGRPLQLRAGSRGWFGFRRNAGVHLEAGPATADTRRALRLRLAEALVQAGAPRPWADGAPLGALVAEAAKRFRG
jgi:hypothetical protein